MTKRNADLDRMPEQGQHYSDFSRVLEEELESDIELKREYEAELVKLQTVAKLDALRREKGWTQGKLAECSGTTQPMLSRLFGGDDERSPTLETLVKIGLALGKRMRIDFVDAGVRSERVLAISSQRPTFGWSVPAVSANPELAAVVSRGWESPERLTTSANHEAVLLI